MGRRSTAAALLAGVAIAAGAACGEGGDDVDATAPADPAAAVELARLVNETRERELELRNAEHRIVTDCLEDAGHLVHDEWTLVEFDTDVDHYPFDQWLPEREAAERRGFGIWAAAPEARGGAEAAELHGGGGRGTVDNAAFEALTQWERREWYVAYGGEAWAQAYHAADYLSESELRELLESAAGAGLEAGTPEPGGCLLEMIEAVYGDPRPRPAASPDAAAVDPWFWRPEAPIGVYDVGTAALIPQWHGGLADAQSAMTDCLSERGPADWRFDQYGELPVWPYWQQAYFGAEPGEAGVPALPADLPGDFEGMKAAEIAMAVDFAECADASGYREAAAIAWDRLHYEAYSALEAELYAWRDAVDAALAKAQGHITT